MVEQQSLSILEKRRERAKSREFHALDSLIQQELGDQLNALNAVGTTTYIVEGDYLFFRYSQNRELGREENGFSYFNQRLPINDESIAGHVAKSLDTLRIPDVYDISDNFPYKFDKRFDEESGFRTKSMICAPIINCNGEILGVLQFVNKKENGRVIPFSLEDQEKLESFSVSATDAIVTGIHSRREIERYGEIATRHDPLESGLHMRRVSIYGSALLGNLFAKPSENVINSLRERFSKSQDENVDDREIRMYQSDFELASIPHDIGKSEISPSIMQKPGKLSDEERKEMQKHTTLGAKIIDSKDKRKLAVGEMARRIALYHHEKWNGSGYPEGLSGNDIPLSARILAVVDVYDALTSKRCYKDAFSHEKACDEIEIESGTHFDPSIVNSFINIQSIINEIREHYKE